MTIEARELYRSSSGDSWSLNRNRRGDLVIFHQPNRASGGRPSEIELSSFLGSANRGPEHRALRELIGELISTNNVQAEYDDHD